jgi:hypothetical protein
VPSRSAALTVLLTGLLTFGIVFTLLEFSRSQAAPADTSPSQTNPASRALPVVAGDSLVRSIRPDNLAVGVPVPQSEALLLRDVQPGDRLDILASLSSPRDAQPVTAVVVRGATVLRPGTSIDPLLLQVTASDAIALVHLVSSGVHLGYVVWPADGSSHLGQVPLLDEPTVRRLLGLESPAESAVTSTPTATPNPTPDPNPTQAEGSGSGFLYQVQTGDTWESVAALFGIPVQRLRDWNEASNEPDPVADRLVFTPRSA